jgi:tetratricopeptide (TPR) repeat protein
MRSLRSGAIALAVLLSSSPAAQSSATLALLDRYAAGEFAPVEAALAETNNFKRLYKDLKNDDLKPWLAAGGPSDRDRRTLAAATFALEAARADAWQEWKWIQQQKGLGQPSGPEFAGLPRNVSMSKLPVLYWLPPPLLIEWGCTLLRETPEPRAIERIWQLAAMAVGQRGEDFQFLIGFTRLESDEPIPIAAAEAAPQAPLPRVGGIPVMPRSSDYFPDEVVNANATIGHLNHVVARFPAEKRFLLGEGLARERPVPVEAAKVYTTLLDDPQVGGEAAMRLGAMYLRQGRVSPALPLFDRADRQTRDRDVVYLARFYRGQALLRTGRQADAIAAFRAALDARPGSQSASVALATVLAQRGRRGEAQALMKAALEAGSEHRDPHLEYVHGDDRFWPILIARLRAEIKK